MKKTINGIAFVVIAGVILSAFFMKGSPSAQKESSAQLSLDQFSAPLQSDFVVANPGIDNLPTQSISPEEKAGMLYMREEEKLARDVYATLYGGWKFQVFANIAQSENTHTDAVAALLKKYKIDDPVKDDTVGKFTNPTLAKLYTDSIEKGSKSLEDALAVSASIEDLDISDLAKYFAQTDNDDIKLIYSNLARASRNHLRTFAAQLGARGVAYTPAYISAEEYGDIVSTPKETGMPAPVAATSTQASATK